MTSRSSLRTAIAGAFFLLFLSPADAQKEVIEDSQFWGGYFNQTRFSDRWGSWTDLHLRTRDRFYGAFFQAVVRAGVTYYLHDDLRLTAGYAYIHHFPADPKKGVGRPEHRPWQGLQWQTRYPGFRFTQGWRLEQRFRRKLLGDGLGSGYDFNIRARYSLLGQVPLGRRPFAPKSLSLVVSDEVLLNFGKAIVHNTFDQNRFFAGFSYWVNSSDQLQVGYMHVFQQLAAGNQYRSNHVARVYYLHGLDLRKR